MSEKTMRVQDYPLATRCPEHILTPTGKPLTDITLEKVLSGEVGPQDVRISRQTLEYQAQIAEQMQRHAVARNFRRAAELIAIPDERILAIYNALRPFRSSQAELLAIADELELRYPELPLYFDLGELRGYHYHTGVVFAAFVPGVGYAIAQGGRYDDIGADFGRARPATGFSTDLKTLVTLGRAEVELPSGGIWMPDSGDAALWQQVCQLRNEGQRVVQALPGQPLSAALEADCDRQLIQQDGRWQVLPLAQ